MLRYGRNFEVLSAPFRKSTGIMRRDTVVGTRRMPLGLAAFVSCQCAEDAAVLGSTASHWQEWCELHMYELHELHMYAGAGALAQE